jgi:hypothetical protein
MKNGLQFRNLPGFKIVLFTGIAVLSLTGCLEKQQKATPLVELPGSYVLTFQDEFNGEKLDTMVWGFHNLGKRRSAVNLKEACLVNGNGELEIRNWTVISGTDTTHHEGIIQTKIDYTFGNY